MSKYLLRTVYAGALVLGLTTVGAPQSFAQSWLNPAYVPPAHCPPGLAKKGNGCRPPGLTNAHGPTATGPVRAHDPMSAPDRKTGAVRTQDRRSHQVLASSNGPNAIDRDIRRDRVSR